MRNDSLADLVRFHHQVQKLRVAQGNRAFASREANKQDVADLHSSWHSILTDLEKSVEREYKHVLADLPGWKWMKRIKGVGVGLGASILAEVDFERAPTVSALWRYAGMAVTPEGKREYPTKGQKLPYNKELKKRMFLFSTGQLKAGGPYKPYYYQAKEKYQGERDWTKAHIHFAALRIPSKLFLQHLWVVGREELGLDVVGPWISVYGGRAEQRLDPWSLCEPE